MKWLFLFTFFVIVNSSAFAQIQYGTVGVVYYTKNKIIMAADSRGHGLAENGPPDDTVCKIAAPHGQVVFVSSHATVYRNGGYADFVQSWSNIEEIHRAYDRASLLYSTKHDRIVGAGIEWGKSISINFQSLFLWHPEQVIEAARKGNGILTRAMIGGLDDNGEMILLGTIVTYQEGSLPHVSSTTRPVDCPRSYCAIGQVEIEQEFVNLTSKRARKEAKKWKPPKKSDPIDRDILRTMRLVDLTIQYHGDDVGGRVDAVQMGKDGSLRWLTIKENCAKD